MMMIVGRICKQAEREVRTNCGVDTGIVICKLFILLLLCQFWSYVRGKNGLTASTVRIWTIFIISSEFPDRICSDTKSPDMFDIFPRRINEDFSRHGDNL
jgi:hypothetical protein